MSVTELARPPGHGSDAAEGTKSRGRAAAGPPDRLWLPLLVLDSAGPLHSRVLLQSIVFLVQHGGGIDTYDFGGRRHGPYSDCLDLDAASYPSLISYYAGEPYDYQDYRSHRYYRYEITDRGRNALRSITGRMDADGIASAREAVARVSGKPLCELLEAAYGMFPAQSGGRAGTESRLKDCLSKSIRPIRSGFDAHGGVQAVTVLSVMETVQIMLSEAKTGDAAQRAVMLGLFTELAQRCIDAAKAIGPEDRDSAEGPAFAEINDLLYCAVQYCEGRNIARDPAQKPLNETLTGDEIRRLAKAFWESETPK